MVLLGASLIVSVQAAFEPALSKEKHRELL
jgi:hypothetical protein